MEIFRNNHSHSVYLQRCWSAHSCHSKEMLYYRTLHVLYHYSHLNFEEEECLSSQWTRDCWEFLQHPLKLPAFGSFVPLLFNCCLCDSIYHLEPLPCVMNFLNLKCENLLLNTGLLRGRCRGGRSRRTQRREGGGET